MLFCIAGKLLEIGGGKILAGNQQGWSSGNQSNRREVHCGIVRWMPVKTLIKGKNAGDTEQKLVAIWRSMRHAFRAGYAACTTNVFHNHLLTEDMAHAGGDHTRDHVSRTTGRIWDYHRHWPSWPTL